MPKANWTFALRLGCSDLERIAERATGVAGAAALGSATLVAAGLRLQAAGVGLRLRSLSALGCDAAYRCEKLVLLDEVDRAPSPSESSAAALLAGMGVFRLLGLWACCCS